MTWEVFLDVLLDALKDSALVLAFVFLFHLLLSFIEDKMSKLITKNRFTGPLLGSTFGLIPQCGTSVLAADLYVKKYVTLGTIIATFLSCSDEALIVLLTHPNERTWMVLPLIGSKFVIGVIAGYVIDLLYKKQEVLSPKQEELVDVTCDGHHHKDEEKHLHKHLWHPLIHSLEIFAYVLVINIVLGVIIASVGEDNFSNFIKSNAYLSPLFASIVGLIPNCASSVLLSELFISGDLSFGALLGGLLVNAGLGIVMMLTKKETIKKALIVLGICFAISLVMGYVFFFIPGL